MVKEIPNPPPSSKSVAKFLSALAIGFAGFNRISLSVQRSNF